jgi:hypothetical protein
VISHVLTLFVVTGLGMAAAGLYLLPVLVGWARHVPGLAAIAVINITLGWTFFGWVAALALALRPVYPAGPLVQFVQHLPPPSPPPSQPSGTAGWAGPPGPPPPRQDVPPPLPPPRPGTTGLPAAGPRSQSGDLPEDRHG